LPIVVFDLRATDSIPRAASDAHAGTRVGDFETKFAEPQAEKASR
jgi:hypothetical protein